MKTDYLWWAEGSGEENSSTHWSPYSQTFPSQKHWAEMLLLAFQRILRSQALFVLAKPGHFHFLGVFELLGFLGWGKSLWWGGEVRRAVATLWHSLFVGADSLGNTITGSVKSSLQLILPLLARVCTLQCGLSYCRNCLLGNYHFYHFGILRPGFQRATKKPSWFK